MLPDKVRESNVELLSERYVGSVPTASLNTLSKHVITS